VDPFENLPSHRLRRIEQKVDAIAERLGLLQKEELSIMADANSVLAKITANTSVLNSIAAAATALEAGHSTIQDEITALKAQIAAGTPPDFTALDAAADAQSTLIGGIATAIPANTPAA